MDFSELIKKRYSVRKFQTTPVEDEKLQQVLDAARLAPSAVNLQPFQFIAVHTAGREQELRRICKADYFFKAPVVICACGIPSKAWTRWDDKNYCEVDVAIAMDHLILAATELGLGTCWIATFDTSAAREVLRLPEGVEPIVFTPLGYPADKPGAKKRKNLSELVRYEHW
ncbi:MAG: nitroreductase family protein [Candidatus Freyarchaeum deiterrae]